MSDTVITVRCITPCIKVIMSDTVINVIMSDTVITSHDTVGLLQFPAVHVDDAQLCPGLEKTHVVPLLVFWPLQAARRSMTRRPRG